jgi:predicted AAA+ superfamily ATPase
MPACRPTTRTATSPGDVLRELFNDYGPCLILIDEWVAYARQLHDQSDLPAGGFETQFSFAQVLTESAKLAKHCLLVISLPASDTSGIAHAHADDIEVGGTRGREALDRLRNVVGRLESSWRPASAEEGFEIVRRRLFQPITDPAHFKDRDVTARAFAELYRTQQAEFPPECRETDYEQRLKAAYPIHPEVFDRLYTDWSTLVKFQRTRGVLRLMAAVIHSLWEKGDRNPLILPANVAIDDARVQSELTRYLSDNWVPVIEKDVDGPSSLPLKLDSELPNLGKFSACRRVARAVYMGSAPTTAAAHKGIEDRRVKLGCVMPGESPAVFGDALRRMAAAATYLYQDGPHYWYSTQPTVTKLAEDRAEQLKREPDKVAHELEQRLRKDLTARATSPASIRCRRPAPMSRTTWTRAWWCWASVSPTQRRPTARPSSPPRRSWRRAATARASIAIPWSSWPRTRPACRISTRRRANTWRGSRSSPTRRTWI